MILVLGGNPQRPGAKQWAAAIRDRALRRLETAQPFFDMRRVFAQKSIQSASTEAGTGT
ncbi:protein of unknown function [Acidithiobacillus ferrivorans]|uniref:Uncharacterized protein n=1 Tax=Acidithiobacillus ferrivorans TaxID=160808 RepID=A0ABY1MLL4_9PROT|nr:protein of unknown function [Acidithiobacillus ferrivorans]